MGRNRHAAATAMQMSNPPTGETEKQQPAAVTPGSRHMHIVVPLWQACPPSESRAVGPEREHVGVIGKTPKSHPASLLGFRPCGGAGPRPEKGLPPDHTVRSRTPTGLQTAVAHFPSQSGGDACLGREASDARRARRACCPLGSQRQCSPYKSTVPSASRQVGCILTGLFHARMRRMRAQGGGEVGLAERPTEIPGEVRRNLLRLQLRTDKLLREK